MKLQHIELSKLKLSAVNVRMVCALPRPEETAIGVFAFKPDAGAILYPPFFRTTVLMTRPHFNRLHFLNSSPNTQPLVKPFHVMPRQHRVRVSGSADRSIPSILLN